MADDVSIAELLLYVLSETDFLLAILGPLLGRRAALDAVGDGRRLLRGLACLDLGGDILAKGPLGG